ncbi:MAG: DNA-3-methyladenine glycosylase [Candidatus Methanomethylicia archaeon]
MIIGREFYLQDPEEVSIKLLGKLLVREVNGIRMSGYIVETEAYYGAWDPASRAHKSMKGDLAKTLYGEVGLTLIYGVHGKWLLNIVSHLEGDGGAVLIRAIEPCEGIEQMIKNAGVRDITKLSNGPGKLCKAMAIDKALHRKPVYTKTSGIWIEEGRKVENYEIERSNRIGVKRDLSKPLRFYVKGNIYVSRSK